MESIPSSELLTVEGGLLTGPALGPLYLAVAVLSFLARN
jgi:hypothetical protein